VIVSEPPVPLPVDGTGGSTLGAEIEPVTVVVAPAFAGVPGNPPTMKAEDAAASAATSTMRRSAKRDTIKVRPLPLSNHPLSVHPCRRPPRAGGDEPLSSPAVPTLREHYTRRVVNFIQLQHSC
jgi:hypothetical protein